MPPPVRIHGGLHRVLSLPAFSLWQGKAPVWWELQIPLHRQTSPVEEGSEQIRVQIYSEEDLAQSDEARNVQHPIRIEMLQLQFPLVQQPEQERVRGCPSSCS